MSDDADKRFEATPARRERARREGNAARSTELAGIAAFATGLGALGAVLPLLANGAAQNVRARAAAPLDSQVGILVPLLALAFAPAVAAAVTALVVTFAQTGGVRPAPLRFAFAPLAPAKGLKRMFGGDAAVGAARALAALLVTLAAVVPAATSVLGVATRASSPSAVASAARDGAFAAAFAACAAGALFALADFALVRRRWLRSLRMSFDEFKRELKEQDGDPQARSRRRQMHRALARGGIERTRDASFVVVNPTHVAIALRYAPPAVPVPEILVRVTDEAALAVRRIAEREAIPLVEDAALARWLFRIGEAGRPIPAEAFVAVAEVIAALLRQGLLDVAGERPLR